MSENATIERGEQATLLDLQTKSLNPYWIDPKQPLLVPHNPLHYEAHKLQLILERLEIQAAKNPAQFNSGNYILILTRLSKLWQAIKDGKTADEVLDESGVDQVSARSKASPVGAGAATGVDLGVSADNPLAG